MTLKKLEEKELFLIYRRYVLKFFPEAVLKAEDHVRYLYLRRRYTGYGLYEGGRLLAFGLFITRPDAQELLLDYFVVLKKYRGKGYAEQFFREMKQLPDVAGVFLELPVDSEAGSFLRGIGIYPTGLVSELAPTKAKIWYEPVRVSPDAEVLPVKLGRLYEVVVPGFKEKRELVHRWDAEPESGERA